MRTVKMMTMAMLMVILISDRETGDHHDSREEEGDYELHEP